MPPTHTPAGWKSKSFTEKIFPESISKSLHSFDIYIYPHNNFSSFASNFYNIFFFNKYNNEILIQQTHPPATTSTPTHPQPERLQPNSRKRLTLKTTSANPEHLLLTHQGSLVFAETLRPHTSSSIKFCPGTQILSKDFFLKSLWKSVKIFWKVCETFLLPCWLMDRDFEKLLPSPAWSCENFFWKVC